jgi:site-specific DNA-methyltransferase (adenine-specific)
MNDWTSEDGAVRLICGDCLEILPTLAPGSVDAVVTDPPYAIPAAHYIGKRGEETPRRNLGELSIVEQWFGMVASHFPTSASLYVFCDGQSYPVFFRACYNRWRWVRPLIWDKVVSYNGYTWRHQHELIAWCEPHGATRIPTGDGDIIKCRAVKVDEREHPAEKPVELIEKLIAKTHGTVLDPFAGSGTTGVACVNTGRRFIGIEIDPGYFEIAKRRIQAAMEKRQQQLIPAA